MRVSSPAAPRRSRVVAEETRALILDAAEHEFAAHGFASARLEDIASRVEITRTAIIYHFGDKQALYDEVLKAIFSDLAERTRKALEPNAPHSERIERLVDTWIDVATTRPTLAQIFLREVANAQGQFRPAVRELVEPMFAGVIEGVEAGQRDGAFRSVDPHHVVSILAGATMWHATNDPLLAPADDDGERARFEAAYRAELIGVTRFLLRSTNPEDPPHE